MATTLTGGNPHIVQLPKTTTASSPSEPRTIAQQWLTALEIQLARPESLALSELFHAESWWRDMLALDWDMRTAHTSSEIEELLRKRQGQARLSKFKLQDKGKFQPHWEQVVDGLSWVSSMFFFETAFGTGTGMLRLTQDGGDGAWKAYAVYTSLQELKGFEEPLGKRRPEGTTESMPDGLAGGTWVERRERQKEFLDSEPTVLVVGAGKLLLWLRSPLAAVALILFIGQAGLNMGARLQNLGLSCLIIDKHERVGDNWRKRYRVSIHSFLVIVFARRC